MRAQHDQVPRLVYNTTVKGDRSNFQIATEIKTTSMGVTGGVL
jgi:hypothetical protein